jgi:ubiquitin-conjugating enzyme E2 Q
MVYSTSDSVPASILDILEVVTPSVAGSSISDMLSTVSEAFDLRLAAESIPTQLHSLEEIDEAEDSLSDNDDSWDDDELQQDDPFDSGQSQLRSTKRLQLDLQAVKRAGFKVGCLGDVRGTVIISVSCRIAKLGISEEAMQAWNVRSEQYLVLLTRFPNKYLDFDQIMEDTSKGAQQSVQMHVGLCESYKPSLDSAVQAFAALNQIAPGKQDGSAPLLVPLFIEKPLNSLLNTRFIAILSHRWQYGHTWAGAELYFNDSQGKLTDYLTAGLDKYFVKEDWGSSTPIWLQSDHLTSVARSSPWSFPLLAMQFTLRHVVKCTEFCLVCYCKIDAGFEALKPYVCSKPLCLYQYMALGMGPSLEWEILTQPYVVDLLISFTYSSAVSGQLQDFPEGLGFKIPEALYQNFTGKISSSPLKPHTARLLRSKMVLFLTDTAAERYLKVGDWIVITSLDGGKNRDRNDFWHCRVNTTIDWPTVDLSDPIIVSDCPSKEMEKIAQSQKSQLTEFYVYDKTFDDLEGKNDDVQKKRDAIVMLLDTLPSVEEMRKFLNSRQAECRPHLSSWYRISASALEVMRWIVASNRSCIVQGSGLDGDEDGQSSEDLVSGMEEYMQFRFAQGAPDKEERFLSAVNAAASDLGSKYPTLFAWHGSPLHNWHGIVREGLNFDKEVHGRSYGDGVYLARHFTTSLTYAGPYVRKKWPNSVLNVSMAISLNEVVNFPGRFVQCNDFCYVVNKIDWIQTRYLFVRCISDSAKKQQHQKRCPPSHVYLQDPKHVVTGPNKRPVAIPITALSRRRRTDDVESSSQQPKKKSPTATKVRKRKSVDNYPVAEEAADNAESVATLDEDLAILLSENEEDEEEEGQEVGASSMAKAKDRQPSKKLKGVVPKPNNLTDFEPDTLTESSLTLLAVPTYATTSATKTLQTLLQTTLKVQEEQPAHELGWYISPRLIDNVYHWIVELHSFDVDLPLAKDLTAAGLQSIVMEMRFPKDFPMTPPFVRVIRPRLLEFTHGGGGHVTAGGALCMELLTNSGWSPIASIESVLLQIRMSICSLDPKPARLQPRQNQTKVSEYSVQEAVSAYVRACKAHAWEVPKDFERMSSAWI